MILEQVKQIKRVLREIFYFKKIVVKYGEHLLPGRYCLFPSLRAIAAEDPVSLENAKRYFAKNKQPGKVAALISEVNKTNYYRNNKKGGAELYEAVYSANNYDKVREIKLFSFARKEILTVCTNEAARQKQLAEYESLHKYFDMPRLEKRDVYDHAYQIAMVDLAPHPDERLALETISRCVCDYRQAHVAEEKVVSVQEIVTFAYEQQQINDILAKVAKKINPAALELRLPLCFQHGDLSRDNLIYGACAGRTDFWWIDWEHAGQRLFFYDYFFYILNTALYFQDTTALRGYLDGSYDDHLYQYFSRFDLQYEPRFNRDYFLIFAVAFLKERVCDRGNANALKMYWEFIKNAVADKE